MWHVTPDMWHMTCVGSRQQHCSVRLKTKKKIRVGYPQQSWIAPPTWLMWPWSVKTSYYWNKPVTMNSEKCQYFDKGYCKSRDKCSLKHPLVECEGSCEDRRICPKRHRVFCKNGNECVFDLTNSCEFLHKADNKSTERHHATLQSMIKHFEGKIGEIN